MKKFKIVLLLLIVLLISGCSGTYNLKINDNLTVEENLIITLENEVDNYDKIDNLINSEVGNKKDYSISKDGNNLNVSYKKKYDTIEEYLLDSILYKQIFNSISYNSDDNEISLGARNILNLSTSDLNNSYDLKILQINVQTPLEVIDENADFVNENTYSWTINDKTQEKDMYLVFNKEKFVLNRGTIILISALGLVVIGLIIIIIKRLLDARKI
jgi:hypothetical protein